MKLERMNRADGLRQRVYETLREQISLGRIGHDQRLIENAVADALGVSRTPVREALALLAREGLLVATTRGFVLPELAEADIAEIYQLRGLLEPAAFRDAVANMTAAGIAAMRGALADQRAAHVRNDFLGFAEGNARFRAAWLALVPNRRLVDAVALYSDHFQIIRVRLQVGAVRQIVIDGQARALAAAEARDLAAARRAIAAHVAAAEVEARTLMQQQRAALTGPAPANAA